MSEKRLTSKVPRKLQIDFNKAKKVDINFARDQKAADRFLGGREKLSRNIGGNRYGSSQFSTEDLSLIDLAKRRREIVNSTRKAIKDAGGEIFPKMTVKEVRDYLNLPSVVSKDPYEAEKLANKLKDRKWELSINTKQSPITRRPIEVTNPRPGEWRRGTGYILTANKNTDPIDLSKYKKASDTSKDFDVKDLFKKMKEKKTESVDGKESYNVGTWGGDQVFGHGKVTPWGMIKKIGKLGIGVDTTLSLLGQQPWEETATHAVQKYVPLLLQSENLGGQEEIEFTNNRIKELKERGVGYSDAHMARMELLAREKKAREHQEVKRQLKAGEIRPSIMDAPLMLNF